MSFDAVIIGAGPAGGHCARKLSGKGYKVLLVEQHSSFLDNNFSSAAAPLEILENFDLPPTVVARYWRNIEIVSTTIKRSWSSSRPLGVVFEFSRLRKFLAATVRDNGGEVRLGCRYLRYEREGENLRVYVKYNGEIHGIKTRILIDATGYSRAVMYADKKQKPSFLKGIGIEYLIKIDNSCYEKYRDSLVFFLGHKWSPKGYGWIFPMEENTLKVGAAWLEGEHPYIKRTKALKDYIKQIIAQYIGADSYELIDSHGSILEYSIGLEDIYYKNPNIVAIGDAVSTVNFLGGEGIRHGMKGAEIACKYIEKYLEGKLKNFQEYEKEMKAYCEPRWSLSDRLSRKVYLEYSDDRIDRGVSYLKYLSLQDIIDILFYYKFERYSRGLGQYLWGKIRQYGSKILTRKGNDRPR